MSNYHRCCAKRRYVKAYRDAQIRRSRAKSAVKRLERDVSKGAIALDESVRGVYQKLKRISETRVVGPRWRTPRPGRRW